MNRQFDDFFRENDGFYFYDVWYLQAQHSVEIAEIYSHTFLAKIL